MKPLLFLLSLLPLQIAVANPALDADTTLPPFSGADKHTHVLDCMAANEPSENLSAQFVVRTRDNTDNLHRISGQAYLGHTGDAYSMVIRLTSPRHLEGVSYLIEDIEDSEELLVYLPSLGKTRKVVAGDSDITLLATALTISDLRQVFSMFSQSWMDYPGKLNQRPIQRINFVPLPDAPDEYLQLRTWVDDQTCLPLQTQLQRKSGNKVIARLEPDSMRQLNDSWIVTQATVEDESTGISSEIELREIHQASDFPAARFASDSFYQ